MPSGHAGNTGAGWRDGAPGQRARCLSHGAYDLGKTPDALKLLDSVNVLDEVRYVDRDVTPGKVYAYP